jgi:hypothetical protein
MTTPRREFLKRTGLGASALAVFPSLSSAGTPVSPAAQDSYARDAMRRLRAHEHTVIDAQAKWDTTWMQRVKGKHRAMFDVPLVELGYPILRSGIWVEQVQEVFGAPAAEISAVIVVRHDAIPLIMDHAYWSTYSAGEVFKVKDEDGNALTYNPVLTPPAGKQGSGPPRLALDKQIERGAIVLGCNLAFGDVVESIQKKDKVSAADARATALKHLIPGAIMQPSGIFANVAAQQVGCLFVEASL